jgi:putative spermidine/putrescine transport system permease protein
MTAPGPATTGPELRARLRRSQRRTVLVSLALVAPAVLFLALFFVVPIVQMLTMSVHDRSVAEGMPRTADVIGTWDRDGLPAEEVYAAIAQDLIEGQQARALAGPARRLNQEISGYRTVIFGTARGLPDAPETSWRETLIEADDRWADPAHLVVLQRAANPLTDYFMLYALDMERDLQDSIRLQDPDQRLFLGLIQRTLTIAVTVTLVCLLMGYPVAYLLANIGGSLRYALLVLVLLPFWTSLLVRTAAWIVVLQTEGIANTALLWTGITSEPIRMIYNRFGTVVVMSQVLLPFMILPLYAVMSGISHWHMRAAQSLGASFLTAFRRVYMPQTLPGVAAGTLLVFMLSIGYYITPALVGGSGDQMLSYFIAFYATETVNWGLAAALGTVLMVIVLTMFLVYTWFFGVERIKVS